MKSDAELSELAIRAKADNEAFKELCSSLERLLYFHARKYVSWYLTLDELLNMVRFELWLAVMRYEPEKSPFAYYANLNITRHMITFARRQRGESKIHNIKAARLDEPLESEYGSEMETGIEDKRVNIEQKIIKRETAGILHKALKERLTDIEYQIVTMFWMEDKGYNEIAESIGVSRKTVDNALVRAKSKLSKDESLRRYVGVAM